MRSHQCTLFSAPSYGRIWTFSKDGETDEVEVRGSVRADNGLVLLSAALQDLGLIVVAEWMVWAHLRRGELVRVLQDYTVSPHPDHAELYAVFPSSRGASRKVRVFVDFLLATFSALSSDPAGSSQSQKPALSKDGS